MVDVSDKRVTQRRAHARAVVALTEEIMTQLEEGILESKKGPVFETATIAGIMAAKRTYDLIPLCHTLLLEDCQVHLNPAQGNRVVIDCRVRATHKTGVEMEALTGASIAALTLVDMCKALSHEITIESIRLIEKTGGKNDYRCPPEP